MSRLIKTKFFYRFLFWAFAISLFLSLPLEIKAQVGWTKSYENGIVVTAEKRASEVGRNILKQGGNAVDAAVAVQFALAVTLPRAGNIGGGGFYGNPPGRWQQQSTGFSGESPTKSRAGYVYQGWKICPQAES